MITRIWRMAMIVVLVGIGLWQALPAAASNHTIQLVSITCIKKDDPLNKDKPSIKLSGITVWSGQDFTNGSSASLLTVPARSFSTQINLDLYEEDNTSADDFLGRNTVLANQAGAGDQTATFAEHGALYEITYRVN